MKICKKCLIEKDEKKFSKDNTQKDKLQNMCKTCHKEYSQKYYEENKETINANSKEYHQQNKEHIALQQKQYYESNKEDILEKQKLYYEENKEKITEYSKNWYNENKEQILNNHKIYRDKNKEKSKQYYLENKEHLSEYNKKYYEDNKSTIIKKVVEYERNKLKTDFIFKLIKNIRTSFKEWLNGFKKDKRTFEYVNCTKDELVSHLESLFLEGMTWENYGEWHIDHIKPLSSFDPTKEEDMHEAWSKENLQPLWAKDNIKKGNKY